MKFEKIECVSADELRKAVKKMADECGSQNAAGRKMGVSQGLMSSVLLGSNSFGPKIAEFFGLEVRKVYVKKA